MRQQPEGGWRVMAENYMTQSAMPEPSEEDEPDLPETPDQPDPPDEPQANVSQREYDELREEGKALLIRFKGALDILRYYGDPTSWDDDENLKTWQRRVDSAQEPWQPAKDFIDEQRRREDTALDSLLVAAMKNEPRRLDEAAGEGDKYSDLAPDKVVISLKDRRTWAGLWMIATAYRATRNRDRRAEERDFGKDLLARLDSLSAEDV